MGKALKHYEGLGQGNLRHNGWQEQLAPFVDDVAEVFIDPADDEPRSYAITSKAVSFGANDHAKITIIESDDEVIEIDNTNCTGTPSVPGVTGDFAVRHLGLVNALLYGGSVRSFEPTEIDLADTTHEPLVVWWLPDREHGFVCGSVVVIDNPNEPPEPSGTEPDATLTPEPTSEPSVSEPPDVPDSGDVTLCSGSSPTSWVSGLCGEYRDGSDNFSGPTCDFRVDPDFFYPWGTGLACEAGDKGGIKQLWHPAGCEGFLEANLWPMSVVFRGQIKADYDEAYQFYLSYDDATTLIVDNTTVFTTSGHTWSDCLIQIGSPQTMSADTWVDVELYTYNFASWSQVRLQWESSSTPRQDIPGSNLRTAAP